jgi:hypothetical protein
MSTEALAKLLQAELDASGWVYTGIAGSIQEAVAKLAQTIHRKMRQPVQRKPRARKHVPLKHPVDYSKVF